MNRLKERVEATPMADYSRRSRIHRFKSLDFPGLEAYLKRDDELGFGISGSKLRKYLSLVPAMLAEAPDEAIIVGSAFSNNVVSMSQVALENGIKPVLLLQGKKPDKITGNFLLASLMVDPADMHWIDSFETVSAWTENYQQAHPKKKVYLVPIGANRSEALPGALTLPLDIVRNEEEAGFSFDHIFVDAGTGMTAIALLLGFTWLGKKTDIHVVHMADNLEKFQMRIAEWQSEFERFMGSPLPSPPRFNSYRPRNAASFGAVNATVIKTISSTLKNGGVLLDPIYSAKLLHESRHIIEAEKLKGKCLFIHSGGGLALLGFVEQLKKCRLPK